MKKLKLFTAIFLSVIICSCGGGGAVKKKVSEEIKSSGKSEQSDENAALYSKEGMMQKLKELNIIIPESLQYDTIDSQSIHFKVSKTDSALRKQLDDSYDKICSDLRAAGWNESMDNKNLNLGGIVKTSFRYKKPVGGKFNEILIISKEYFESNGDYFLYISYFPKY